MENPWGLVLIATGIMVGLWAAFKGKPERPGATPSDRLLNMLPEPYWKAVVYLMAVFGVVVGVAIGWFGL